MITQTLNFAPSRVQDVLRAFAPRADRPVPVGLAALAAPVYITKDGKRQAFASDGTAAIWTAAKCPGFAEYRAAEAGSRTAVEFHGLWREGSGVPVSGWVPAGRVWEAILTGCPARLRKLDVDRLRLLDSVAVWGGSRLDGSGAAMFKTDSGAPLAWEWVCFAGAFGAATLHGVIRCQRPQIFNRRKS